MDAKFRFVPFSPIRTNRSLVPKAIHFTSSQHPKQNLSLDLSQISHKTLPVNGINMHVAEIGQGPAILFLHGFPELWYSWRHQMIHLSGNGYRAIAPDLRGYGDTDAPPSPESYTVFHIVGDLVALLDALELEQVFLIGHDWGAIIAWNFCLLRPDRIKALVNTSVVFQPRNPAVKPVQGFRDLLGDSFYLCRFQEAGVAEAAFAFAKTTTIIKSVLSSRETKPPCIPILPFGIGVILNFVLAATPLWLKEMAIKSGLPPLPSWLTQEDVEYYAKKFDKTGFTGGLNYYRAMDLNWELSAPWTGSKIKVPVKFIIGDADLTYHFPGVKEYIHNGEFKKYVPLLEEIVVMEGVAHFLNQEKPEEISNHIFDFIKKF